MNRAEKLGAVPNIQNVRHQNKLFKAKELTRNFKRKLNSIAALHQIDKIGRDLTRTQTKSFRKAIRKICDHQTLPVMTNTDP